MPRPKRDTNSAVVALMRRSLDANPEATTEVLRKKAARIDPRLARLDKRVFNARYVLAIRRTLGGKRRTRAAVTPVGTRRGSNGRRSESQRDRVRAILMSLSAQAAVAGDKAALIALFSKIDDYVTRVINAAQ